jgi:polygalacturonase
MRIAAICILISVCCTAATSTVTAQTSRPSGNQASNELPVFNGLNFGAVADGETKNTSAFARASAACRERGGGTIYVPPGVYLSGPIELGRHMTLHVAAGAKILASPQLEDYPVEPKAGWGDGSGESTRAGLVTARDARHVTITGRGVIDGNAMAFHDPDTPHGRIDKRFTRQGDAYMDPKLGVTRIPLLRSFPV